MDPTIFNPVNTPVNSDNDLVQQQTARLEQNLQSAQEFTQALQEFQRADTLLSVERSLTSKLSNDIDQAIQQAAR